MGSDAYGVNRQTISEIVGEVKSVVDLGVQVGVVIGGGNIFRGVAPAANGGRIVPRPTTWGRSPP